MSKAECPPHDWREYKGGFRCARCRKVWGASFACVSPGMAGSGGSNRVLTLAQAAERIGVAPSTLYKHWRDWRGLRGYKAGNLVLFRERNVESFIDQLERVAAR